MAAVKEPRERSSPPRTRLPMTWLPGLFRRMRKRRSRRATKGSSSAAKATRHLRTSPGAVMPGSCRRSPVEPPSSAMATTAEVSKPRDRSARMETGAPVPPPMTRALGAGDAALKTGGSARRSAKAASKVGSKVTMPALGSLPERFQESTGFSASEDVTAVSGFAGADCAAAACTASPVKTFLPVFARERSRCAMLTR